MKILKFLIKTSFFNKINDFLCFDIIKYIFNRRSNKVFISYMIKINTFNPLISSLFSVSKFPDIIINPLLSSLSSVPYIQGGHWPKNCTPNL